MVDYIVYCNDNFDGDIIPRTGRRCQAKFVGDEKKFAIRCKKSTFLLRFRCGKNEAFSALRDHAELDEEHSALHYCEAARRERCEIRERLGRSLRV